MLIITHLKVEEYLQIDKIKVYKLNSRISKLYNSESLKTKSREIQNESFP